MTASIPTMKNWGGSHTFQPTQFHRPTSLDELRRIVARAPKIHAIGARHAFNTIADAAELITLDGLDQSLAIDWHANTATVNAGIRYGALAAALEREGLALHNMASLPHITVAGAVATATHGSGDKLGNLATAVRALELVTSNGDLLRVQRGDPEFAGMVVNVGALGVVTRLTLDVQPTYLVQQEIFEHLPWEVVFDQFDAVTSAADSVSLFTDFGDTINQVWLKTRVGADGPRPRKTDFLGALAAAERRNPVVTFSAEHCTEQLGVPGPWWDRLPHVRMAGVTETGDHLQSEYMVPRRHGLDALRALREIATALRECLWIAEVRTVAADDLWLSTANDTATVCLHFSLKPDLEAVMALLPKMEAALAPFQPRPHWGKLFVATAADLEPRYERLPDFRRLAARLDPRGAFRNAFLDRHVFG